TLPIEGVAIFPDHPAPLRLAVAPSALAWVVLIALIVCGFIGSQEVAENILPTAFWLVAWIAAPISCGLLGDWTRPLNPFAALARAADRPGLRRVIINGPPVAWPEWLGWWPAVV